jgi:uncharacterized membrane protein
MRTARLLLRWLFGVFFIGAGVNHFVHPAMYVAIMPPYLPWHLTLVYVSGACESILGALLLVERTQRMAAWGLVVLLIAVFPANVQMATHAALYPEIPAVALWLRLPLQGLLIAWAWLYTRGNG